MGQTVHNTDPNRIVIKVGLVVIVRSGFVCASPIVCGLGLWRRRIITSVAVITTAAWKELLPAFLAEHGIRSINGIATMETGSWIALLLLFLVITTALILNITANTQDKQKRYWWMEGATDPEPCSHKRRQGCIREGHTNYGVSDVLNSHSFSKRGPPTPYQSLHYSRTTCKPTAERSLALTIDMLSVTEHRY